DDHGSNKNSVRCDSRVAVYERLPQTLVAGRNLRRAFELFDGPLVRRQVGGRTQDTRSYVRRAIRSDTFAGAIQLRNQAFLDVVEPRGRHHVEGAALENINAGRHLEFRVAIAA